MDRCKIPSSSAAAHSSSRPGYGSRQRAPGACLMPPRAPPHPAPLFPRGPHPDPGPLPGSGRAEGSERCRASRTLGLPPYRAPPKGPIRGIAAAPGAPLGELQPEGCSPGDPRRKGSQPGEPDAGTKVARPHYHTAEGLSLPPPSGLPSI